MANPLDGLHDADHAKAEKTEGRMPSVSDPRALARLLELILSTAQAGLAFSFPVDALPPLSEHRVLASQIQTLWQRIHAETPEALFD